MPTTGFRTNDLLWNQAVEVTNVHRQLLKDCIDALSPIAFTLVSPDSIIYNDGEAI
jgi:hypothetical protein